jgi:hypothetical protein
MSIYPRGRYANVVPNDQSWVAVQKIAREFGWLPEYAGDEVPERNARALSRALYQAIRAIEVDCLSEPLVELVREAGIDHLRRVADLAYAGGFYIHSPFGQESGCKIVRVRLGYEEDRDQALDRHYAAHPEDRDGDIVVFVSIRRGPPGWSFLLMITLEQ